MRHSCPQFYTIVGDKSSSQPTSETLGFHRLWASLYPRNNSPQRLTMPRGPSLHASPMVFIVMLTLLSCTTASTLHLLHRNIELQEGPINIPGMLCPTRIGKRVEVTLGGQKMMVSHVECITGNACCGEGGRGRCVQVIDNTSGKEWKRGCQCQIPI